MEVLKVIVEVELATSGWPCEAKEDLIDMLPVPGTGSGVSEIRSIEIKNL